MADETAQERYDRELAEAKAKRAAKRAKKAKEKLEDKADNGFDEDGEMPISGERGGTEGTTIGENKAKRQRRSSASGSGDTRGSRGSR